MDNTTSNMKETSMSASSRHEIANSKAEMESNLQRRGLPFANTIDGIGGNCVRWETVSGDVLAG